MTKNVITVSFSLLVLVAGILGKEAVSAATMFREESARYGLEFRNTDIQSVAWVDFNGDGWLDLWLTGHHMTQRFFRSKLYLNNSGKGFGDVWPLLPRSGFDTDAHGINWIDWDNDGDQDLFVTAGGGSGVGGKGSPSLLFSQENGRFSELAGAVGLDDPLGRGRAAYWYDYNHDGDLDLFVVNSGRPDGKPSHNRLYQRKGAGFVPVRLPEEIQNVPVGQIFLADREFPPAVAVPVVVAGKENADKTGLWLSVPNRRIVSGDFDGDLKLDYLVYSPAETVKEICHVESDRGAVLAVLPRLAPGEKRVFRFKANGPVKLNSKKSPVLKLWRGSSRVAERYGSRILTVLESAYRVEEEKKISLNNGMRIRYLSSKDTWTIEVHQAPEIANTIQFVLEPLADSVDIEPLAPACRERTSMAPKLWLGQRNEPEDLKVKGWNEPLLPGLFLKGDFDNDGDLDLYLSRETPVKDLPDLFLENDGNGVFSAVPVSVDYNYRNPGLSVKELIPGPHAAVGDFNKDGFLDIFLAGRHYYSWLENPRLVAGVPNRLLVNRGNGSHWVEFDLVGNRSNRDAIGARLTITIGGKRVMRYQTGGFDGYQQHSKRLHVGLGEASHIDEVEVIWPSGMKSKLHSVAADRVVMIEEPEAP